MEWAGAKRDYIEYELRDRRLKELITELVIHYGASPKAGERRRFGIFIGGLNNCIGQASPCRLPTVPELRSPLRSCDLSRTYWRVL
ncbi:hypothetical protein GGTG_12574 [Gaeumannomyces tritici R3-111a-1]|uniref:Uncharacterized protein n=1 Tax=Gaeumannomyces tritici (strain R3-111a-1) TaxID=644352 RepID=J3PGE9_GAET3|nr:hypothetical protein GGTG_12574 [Gaeumannomyces tritici R3-111a-1]EJT69691.1 hypothetical protein GGTG_12574 [Gaeumannomyces tritici R3-111a-1]